MLRFRTLFIGQSDLHAAVDLRWSMENSRLKLTRWMQLLLILMYLLMVFAVLVSSDFSNGFPDYGEHLVRSRQTACNEGDCKNKGVCWPGSVGSDTPPCLCPEAYTGSRCTSRINYCTTTPPNCLNGATCTNTDATPWFSCSCAPDFNGSTCEINIDDCASHPCINGQCTDWVNSYSCSCYGGWVGSNCNINHNDCPDGACLNDGRCLDGNGTYTCNCTDTGFRGATCEIEIDECESEPCSNGQCSDLVNSYNCSCYSGWVGSNCSLNHNDCVAGACLNGGRCLDGNGTFSCDCSRIDFQDENCSSKIDDCSPDPCQNNASCIDGLRDYSCSCFSGYSGKTCSGDIVDCVPDKCRFNGSCLERSKRALYGNSSLPAPFNGTFSYALAAGFVCLCPRGTYGNTCEINPNDCLIPDTDQSVCVHASSCTDGLASFTCHCLPGYEGPTCSVDINECELFGQPCQNGAVCKDLVADYACTNCPVGFTSKNCSIRLTGCDSNPCKNNEICQPILEQELPTPVHGYGCTCKPGWTGKQCNEATTASFSGSTSFTALLLTNKTAISSGDWTFELSFRTSLAQFDLIRLSSHWRVIRIGAHNSSLMLLLFNASSSVIGQAAWPISDSLASADWVTLSVSLTNGSATLTRSVSGVRQSQTQLFGGLSDTFKRGQMSVDVGGERGSAIDGGGFRGCVRDLRLVTNDLTFVAMETTVESGNTTWGFCSRSVQCGSPSPCEAKTSLMCSDLWNDFVCHCAAGFGGRDCSVELPSFSFGVGGKASSASFTSVPVVSSVYGGDLWTIEMRLVTLSRGAFLMLLGDPSDSTTTPRLLVTLDSTGRLSSDLQHGNGSQIALLKSSNPVATGSFVSVKISVSISSRELSQAVSSAVRSASLSSASPLSQLSGQLIIGGFSGASAAPAPSLSHSGVSSRDRSKRSANKLPSSVSLSLKYFTAFRGIISAPRINGLLPLILGPVASNMTAPLPRAVATDGSVLVSSGILNEDACSNWSPCQNNATCTNVFYNSYLCNCTIGWRNAECSARDHCILEGQKCPKGTQCLNLEPSGMSCIVDPQATVSSKNDSTPRPEVLAAIAVAIFVFGVLVSVSVFLILLRRHRDGKLSLGYFERQRLPGDKSRTSSASRILSKLANRPSSRTNHAYIIPDRQSRVRTADAYELELTSPYEVANDAGMELACAPTDKERQAATAAGFVQIRGASGASAYDEIPDLRPKPQPRQAWRNAGPEVGQDEQPDRMTTADVMEPGDEGYAKPDQPSAACASIYC